MTDDGSKEVAKHGANWFDPDRITANPTFAFIFSGACLVAAAILASAGKLDSAWFVVSLVIGLVAGGLGLVGCLKQWNAEHSAIEYLTRLLPPEAEVLYGAVVGKNRNMIRKPSLATASLVCQGVLTEIAREGEQATFEIPLFIWERIKDDGKRLCLVAANGCEEEAYYLQRSYEGY